MFAYQMNQAYFALFSGPGEDSLFDGPLANEPVNSDLLSLAESVRPVHGLLVHRWVPIRVIENNLAVNPLLNLEKMFSDVIYYSVSSSEVDTETTSPRRQQEHKYVLSVLEVSYHVSPLGNLAATIKAHVRVLSVVHKLLQQVDHLCHLRVDKHSVALGLQFLQQLVQNRQFATIRYEALFICKEFTMYFQFYHHIN
jgi:hypothetical protein